MGRGHSLDDVYTALDICRGVGLEPVVDVIFGFPFETDEDEEATLALVKRWIGNLENLPSADVLPVRGTTNLTEPVCPNTTFLLILRANS